MILNLFHSILFSKSNSTYHSTGMLQNLDCLPLERIHSMLRMFAVQGPDSGVTPQQLKAFLDRKVREQKLVFAAGVYRLPKH
jgi:anaphase-promoting complex subunit 2